MMHNRYWEGLIQWLGFGTPADRWERKLSHHDFHFNELFDESRADEIGDHVEDILCKELDVKPMKEVKFDFEPHPLSIIPWV